MKSFYQLAVLIGILLALSGPAQAQVTPAPSAPPPPEDPAADSSGSAKAPAALPGIFVTDLNVENANTIAGQTKGTFNLKNGDSKSYSGITYAIELLGPAPVAAGNNLAADNAYVYDRIAGDSSYTLEAGEQQSVSFSYDMPPVPDGDYRLRIKAVSAQREELGWADANIFSTPIPDSGYLVLENGSITAAGSAAQPPQAGVIVKGKESLSLAFTARNVGSESITATPRLKIYRYAGTNASPLTELSGTPVNISPDQSVTGKIDAVAADISGPYYAILDFAPNEGKVASGPFDYRWVVEGAYAKILSAGFTNLAGQPGQNLVLLFDIAGRSNSPLSAKLEADLYNEGRKVQTVTSNEIGLQNAAGSIEISFALQEELTQPEIKARLVSPDGNVLDDLSLTFEVPQPSGVGVASEPSKNLAVIIVIVAAGILLLIISIVLLIRSKRQPPSLPPAAPLLIVLATALLVSGLLGTRQAALADSQGITVNSGAKILNIVGFPNLFVQLFVNSPEHQSDYQPSQIPISFTAKDRLCGCFPLGQYVVDVSYEPDGGWLGSYVPPSQLTQVLHTESDWLRLLPFRPAYNWVGTISIPPSTPYKTTLQFYGRHYVITEDVPLLASWHVIHVFLGSETEPSPQPTPPADGCLQTLKQISSAAECSTDNVRQADITLTLRNVCQPTQNGTPLDVIIVFDRSGSMNEGSKLSDAKTAARALVDELDPATDRIGLVTYANSARVDEQLTQDFTEVRRAINRLDADGGTNIGDGIFDANQELRRRGRAEATPIMIVLTDGIANGTHSGEACENYPRTANRCTQDAINQADAAKSDGVTVFTVGFGLNDLTRQSSQQVLDLARSVLQSMASSLDHFFDAASGAQLIEVLRSIGEQITSGDVFDAVITDVLPSAVQYVSSALPEPASVNGQELVWNIGTIGANQEATIRFKVSFDADTIGQLIDADVFPDSRVDYKDSSSQDKSSPFPQTQVTPERCGPTQCSDLEDNDNDSAIDCADPGCWQGADASTCNPADNDEQHTPSFDPGGFQETE